jgi:hypothetical protein
MSHRQGSPFMSDDSDDHHPQVVHSFCIRKFRCDGASEFVSTAQRARYAELGIALEFFATYTPEQNSDAERDHRYVVEGMRSVQQGRGIPLKMWAESTYHTTYVQNRTLRYGKTQTPYELWFGKIPDVSNLRIFGSTAYIRVPDALRLQGIKIEPSSPRHEMIQSKAS